MNAGLWILCIATVVGTVNACVLGVGLYRALRFEFRRWRMRRYLSRTTPVAERRLRIVR